MCREHGLRQIAGLKQREAQKHGIAHNAPDGCDNVLGECHGLNQYRINADTDHNEEALEAKGKQGTQIILSDIALLSVAKGGERNRSKADHRQNFVCISDFAFRIVLKDTGSFRTDFLCTN